MNIAQNETILDNILKDAKAEILNIAKIYRFGNIDLKINIAKGEIVDIYNLKTERSKKL
jgi:hypothetical protein